MDFGDDYGISRKEAIEKLKLSVQISLHDPEMIQGEVLKKAEETAEKKDSIQFVVTEELEEAISGDIISEVEMDREMRLSKRIVDEILSIYM